MVHLVSKYNGNWVTGEPQMVDVCVSVCLDLNGPSDSQTTVGGPQGYISMKWAAYSIVFFYFYMDLTLFKITPELLQILTYTPCVGRARNL